MVNFRKPLSPYTVHMTQLCTVVHLTKMLDFLKSIQGLQADNHIIKERDCVALESPQLYYFLINCFYLVYYFAILLRTSGMTGCSTEFRLLMHQDHSSEVITTLSEDRKGWKCVQSDCGWESRRRPRAEDSSSSNLSSHSPYKTLFFEKMECGNKL